MALRKRAEAISTTSRRDSCEPLKWTQFADEALLDMRMCDLELRLEKSPLEPRVRLLLGELERKELVFRPYFWLSSDWFTPDGLPGFALPFYLAHERLMKLEESQVLEVEGGNLEWCMRLLRHETGHAISNAYRLHHRKDWRSIFGKSTMPYKPHYVPKPYSKRFVIHLDYWYAQSHPTEDFAETFAVWLTPHLPWRKRFAGWPAIRKLEYVDQLMKEVGASKPPVRSREQCEPVSALQVTLREYYKRKRERYGLAFPNFYDRDLRRLFSDDPAHRECEPASRFMRRISPEIRKLVASWTGEYQYTIDRVLTEMIKRCRVLGLHVHAPPEQTKLEATVLLTVQTMNFLHGGHHRMVR